MRCTNRFSKFVSLILVGSLTLTLAGCGNSELPLDFKSTYSLATTASEDRVPGFAQSLAVTDHDVSSKNGFQPEDMSACGLFDVDRGEVLYAKNVFDQKSPASLTKVLTAICALKHGNVDDVIICSDNVDKLESGASSCGLKPGDQLTLGQALRFMLLPSANDAAIAIAEHVGGSLESFSNMMNEEAALLGATNSHFVNPHGLSADEHYSTAYDMYLIANEAIKYDDFCHIISLKDFSGNVIDRTGAARTIDVKSSNKFIDGTYNAPEGITVIGGKTGTTSAAGSCLILVTKNSSGNTFISVILKASERSVLYDEMIQLLGDIKTR